MAPGRHVRGRCALIGSRSRSPAYITFQSHAGLSAPCSPTPAPRRSFRGRGSPLRPVDAAEAFGRVRSSVASWTSHFTTSWARSLPGARSGARGHWASAESGLAWRSMSRHWRSTYLATSRSTSELWRLGSEPRNRGTGHRYLGCCANCNGSLPPTSPSSTPLIHAERSNETVLVFAFSPSLPSPCSWRRPVLCPGPRGEKGRNCLIRPLLSVPVRYPNFRSCLDHHESPPRRATHQPLTHHPSTIPPTAIPPPPTLTGPAPPAGAAAFDVNGFRRNGRPETCSPDSGPPKRRAVIAPAGGGLLPVLPRSEFRTTLQQSRTFLLGGPLQHMIKQSMSSTLAGAVAREGRSVWVPGFSGGIVARAVRTCLSGLVSSSWWWLARGIVFRKFGSPCEFSEGWAWPAPNRGGMGGEPRAVRRGVNGNSRGAPSRRIASTKKSAAGW